jgi:hypothetical protein
MSESDSIRIHHNGLSIHQSIRHQIFFFKSLLPCILLYNKNTMKHYHFSTRLRQGNNLSQIRPTILIVKVILNHTDLDALSILVHQCIRT